jgi:hypothetical protein
VGVGVWVGCAEGASVAKRLGVDHHCEDEGSETVDTWKGELVEQEWRQVLTGRKRAIFGCSLNETMIGVDQSKE